MLAVKQLLLLKIVCIHFTAKAPRNFPGAFVYLAGTFILKELKDNHGLIIRLIYGKVNFS